MKKVLKWIVITVGVLVLLVGALHFLGQSRLNTAPHINMAMVDIPTDATSIERGQHLAQAVSACTGCHQPDFSGEIFVDEPPIGTIAAPNLTTGEGGIGNNYTDEDWVRAIRHGIGSDGRTLAMMPSNYYAKMSDADLGALVAYLKTVPPVDHRLPERNITFPGTIIFGVLAYRNMPVSIIDHQTTGAAEMPATVGEQGEYLINIGVCRECHGADLAGLTDENGPPPGPNLTPGGPLKSWNEADFVQALRNGLTPDGRVLDPEKMPWPGYAHLTDEELNAIWAYLQTLPEKTPGENE